MIPDELPLSRALVDRSAHLRTAPDAIAAALDDRATLALVVADGAVAAAADGGLALLAVADAADAVRAAGEPEPDRWLLLGADDERRYLALRATPTTSAGRTGSPSDVLVHRPPRRPQPHRVDLGGGLAWVSLRDVGAELDGRSAGLATTAVALDAWHARHPRCPRCGGPTRPTQAGWVRTCEVDGSEHYPRTDPAVIMAVVDDADRILLGHAAAWAEGRFSTLAGFVEAGESLEHAVRREVAEETGVQVGEVEYCASQPWPFPNSLMVGFRARATSTDVRVDGVELTQARWFSRDELAGATTAGSVVPPGPASIARALVEEWFGGPLPRARETF